LDDENKSDIKYNGEAPYGILMENQYDDDPLFEPSCSSTEPHLILKQI
jgi:hypothetical protein